MATNTYIIKYLFKLPEGETVDYSVEIDKESILIIHPKESPPPPEWTKLNWQQCPNCPLSPETTEHCPIAVNLHYMAEKFKAHKSHIECEVTVISSERNYSKKLTLQEGLGSLFGLLMPTSGCPAMDFLKPMARFHLPFSNLDETIYRSTSMYLLSQYFTYKNGETPDLEMKKLDEQYSAVNKVNKGMCERIQTLKEKSGDADNNAIVILDTLAMLLSGEIKNNLKQFEYLFVKNKNNAA